MVTINFQFVTKHSICDTWLRAVQCLKSMPVNQLKQVVKRDWLWLLKRTEQHFLWEDTPFAPCLLCYFPHLRSSLGHETVRFALGTLLKSLPECGAPRNPLIQEIDKIWAPIGEDWRDKHRKIQVIQRPPKLALRPRMPRQDIPSYKPCSSLWGQSLSLRRMASVQ